MIHLEMRIRVLTKAIKRRRKPKTKKEKRNSQLLPQTQRSLLTPLPLCTHVSGALHQTSKTLWRRSDSAWGNVRLAALPDFVR